MESVPGRQPINLNSPEGEAALNELIDVIDQFPEGEVKQQLSIFIEAFIARLGDSIFLESIQVQFALALFDHITNSGYSFTSFSPEEFGALESLTTDGGEALNNALTVGSNLMLGILALALKLGIKFDITQDLLTIVGQIAEGFGKYLTEKAV